VNLSREIIQQWQNQILRFVREDASVSSWLASLLIHALFLLTLALVILRETGEKKAVLSIVFDPTVQEEVSMENPLSDVTLDALARPSSDAGESYD